MNYNSADFGFITIGHYDLTSVTTKLDDTISRPAIESTPYGVTAPEFLPGVLKSYELSGQDGWYDDAADSVNAALVDMTAGENVMILAPYGNAAPNHVSPAVGIGKTCICTDGVLKTEYKRAGEVGGYHKASFGVQVSGLVDQNAKLVAHLIERTVTGTTAAAYLDMGGAGAVGGRAYLVLTDIHWGSRTKLVIKLQDDDVTTFVDHTSFADIVPATTPESAGTSQMVALANAAIYAHTCVTWTWSGGSEGAEAATFAVAVAYD